MPLSPESIGIFLFVCIMAVHLYSISIYETLDRLLPSTTIPKNDASSRI